MHTLLKSIYFYLFAYLAALGLSGGMQNLLAMACELFLGQVKCSSPARIEPQPPALGTQSLSHWTTGEVPHTLLKTLFC